MSYENDLRSLESQLQYSLESDTPVQLSANGVFAGSFADKDYPSNEFLKVKNILLEYEPGKPTEIPIVDGTPYLGLGMDVGRFYTVEDFEQMVDTLWDDARGYSTFELFDRIASEYGDVETLGDIVDLVGISASATLYKISQKLLFPELKRTYRADDLEVFFFEADDRNYIYLNATDLADYETTLSGAEQVAEYLDSL